MLHRLGENLFTKSGWEIIEKEFAAEQLVVTGSNFLTGNGYLGYRGVFAEWRREQYVGCFVTDTYDNADGRWTELCNAPNGLFTTLILDGQELPLPDEASPFKSSGYRRELNMRCGVVTREVLLESESGAKVKLETAHFASYADLHIIPMLYRVEAQSACCVEIITGIDGRVWDLNGRHLFAYKLNAAEDHLAVRAKTGELETQLCVVEGHRAGGIAPQRQEVLMEEETVLRRLVFNLQAGQAVTLEKVMAVYSSNDTADPYAAAVQSLQEAVAKGYERLLQEHRSHWEHLWGEIDVLVEGDLFAQTVLRFNLYHNVIATPFHADYLPVGARGLSCQAYQGAAFWDQEIYNLPMFLYTRPEIARNLLIYRYKTLSGARGKAERLGYRGAFYAWVSGKSGEELCPSFFFKDVLTGREIRNHFNDWQIHVSPDIAYTVRRYLQATGDWSFIEAYGAEILFEVARFLYAHAYFKKDKNRYEFIRLLGPDEYHENVDNNAFTAYQALDSLRTAIDVYEQLRSKNPELFAGLTTRLGIATAEYEQWQEMAALLYLPEPDVNSGIIEQFSGYFDSEDILPANLARRLIDNGEYWGWPNGVAVHTRVIKQADVLQLLVLQDLFPQEILQANYDFYEPYCQHGSSLSPSVHAIVAARIGYAEAAYDYFIRSCTIDLFNTNKAVSGGTFIGGIHTAACGATWQVVVFGFAGMSVSDEGLSFKPAIPAHWDKVTFKLIYRGQSLTLTITASSLEVEAAACNKNPVTVDVYDRCKAIGPGETALFKVTPV